MTSPGWKFGYAWKDQKLYCFTTGQIVVMRLWPDMLAWRRTKTKPWQPTRKFADEALTMRIGTRGECKQQAELVGPFAESDRTSCMFQKNAEKALLPALASIPVVEEGLASSLRGRRWHALALMARCPGATELFQSNMALGFALANNWLFHKPAVTQPMRSARALLSKKQKDILAWLGFPGTSSVRRIFARIDPSALEIGLLLNLQSVIQMPEVQRSLVHLPHISLDILKLLCDQRATGQIDERLLTELSELSAVGQYLPGDVYKKWKAARAVSQAEGLTLPRRIRSVDQLLDWHRDVMAVQPSEWPISDGMPDRFGEPPFRGVLGISPICSVEDLALEGHVMSHCVATYVRQISAGNIYVYRVEHPLRATLAIWRGPAGWRLIEIRGPANSKIPKDQGQAIFHRLVGGKANFGFVQ